MMLFTGLNGETDSSSRPQLIRTRGSFWFGLEGFSQYCFVLLNLLDCFWHPDGLKCDVLYKTYLNKLVFWPFFFSICKRFTVNGLGLIPGVVGRFDSSKGLRVPHIGWNALQLTSNSEILNPIRNNHVYFVHSYRAMPVCLFFSFLFSCFHC